MSETRRLALVTGANRGLGLAIARGLGRSGLRVLLGSRAEADGEAAARSLVDEGIEASSVTLDVDDDASVTAAVAHANDRFGGVDVLVNNAGVFLDPFDMRASSVLTVPPSTFRASFETHFYGPLRLCQAVVPGMIARRYGRVVNVSSIFAQASVSERGFPAYRSSKAALNSLTRLLAAECSAANVLVNAGCPGRVRTRMGGPDAPLSPEEGADTIVWLATLGDDGPRGGFFRERKPLAW